jgi:hypothetical protein
VHSPWRRCSLDGVVGGVGVDEDDAACCCAVAAREGVERAEEGRPSSMPERLYTRQREISVCKFTGTHEGVSDYNNNDEGE